MIENSKAPDFTLKVDGNNEITLSNFTGKNVVLYFYPKDDTPGCTTEAKDFANAAAEFASLNTVVIGISKDTVASHDKFKAKYSLPFILASDITCEISKMYGVWIEKSMFGKKYFGIDRSTFLIDKNQIIKKIWRKVSVTGHVKEVLATITSQGM